MRLAVFASGGGSNFQAILDAVATAELSADVVLLVTDRDSAGAIGRATAHGVPHRIVRPADHADSEAFGAALLDELRGHEADFVALAGYLRHVPPVVVAAYGHRMLNVHPSLLPAFGGKGLYGRRVHEAVLEYGVRWTGATVHLVDEQYDTGPIVLQEPVPVLPGDTPEALAERVLAVEHRLYVDALQLFAAGRVRVEGRTTVFDEV